VPAGTFLFVRKSFLESRSQADRCTIFFDLKKNFLECPGPGSCVGLALHRVGIFLEFFFWKAASMHNFYFLCRRFFWKARHFFCFEEEFFGKPFFSFIKYAAINQPGPKRIDAQFVWIWRRIFWKARVLGHAWSFFF